MKENKASINEYGLRWKHAAKSLQLQYLSRDGEEGYPGNLFAAVSYTVSGNNELRIDYSATTHKGAVLNRPTILTSTLRAKATGDVLAHELTIEADCFTPVGKGLIPTGELKNVAGTPFDFRTPHATRCPAAAGTVSNHNHLPVHD